MNPIFVSSVVTAIASIVLCFTWKRRVIASRYKFAPQEHDVVAIPIFQSAMVTFETAFACFVYPLIFGMVAGALCISPAQKAMFLPMAFLSAGITVFVFLFFQPWRHVLQRVAVAALALFFLSGCGKSENQNFDMSVKTYTLHFSNGKTAIVNPAGGFAQVAVELEDGLRFFTEAEFDSFGFVQDSKRIVWHQPDVRVWNGSSVSDPVGFEGIEKHAKQIVSSILKQDTLLMKFAVNRLANWYEGFAVPNNKLSCQLYWMGHPRQWGWLADTTDVESPEMLTEIERLAIKNSQAAKIFVGGWRIHHIHRRSLAAGYRLEACIQWPKNKGEEIGNMIVVFVP